MNKVLLFFYKIKIVIFCNVFIEVFFGEIVYNKVFY